MKILKCLLIALFAFPSLSVMAQSKVKPEKQFIVYEKGPFMSKVDVRKDLRGAENIVQIEALNVSGGSALLKGAILPGAEISSAIATQGSYNMTRQLSKSGRGETLQLLDVIFPVRLRITISEQVLDVEIKEAGFWKIMVGLTQ